MSQSFILDFVRTGRARGSASGSLAGTPPVELLGALIDQLQKRNSLDLESIDDMIVGTAGQVDAQGSIPPRVAALVRGAVGLPGGSVNRFCASGIDAVGQTAARVRGGDLHLAFAGGSESVSHVPMFADRGPLWADPETVQRVRSVHMGVAADLNATIDRLSRAELDEYSVETHQKAAYAWATGFFDNAVIPISCPDGSVFRRDELIRPGTTMETLAALEPAFGGLGSDGQDALVLEAYPSLKEVRHLHSVGNSPALADAAAMLLLGSEHGVSVSGVRPRGRVLGAEVVSVDAVRMLTGGQLAVEKLLSRFGLIPDDIDVYEFAEAFSALCLKFRRDLGVGPDRMNPNGGTMAMGHAFGATGAILIGSCLEELERRSARYGVAAVSGAAGLGSAVLIERL